MVQTVTSLQAIKRFSSQAGNSYHKLTQSSHDGFRWRLFEKTGCLITTDSSEDNKINPEGLPNYKVQPILLDLWLAPAEPSSVPEHDSEVKEYVFDNFESENEMDDTEIVEDDEFSSDGRISDLFNLEFSF